MQAKIGTIFVGSDCGLTGLACLLPSVPTLGEAIKEFREGQNWTQDELAAKLDVRSQTVSNIETGVTNTLQPRSFNKMAELMGLTPAQLNAKTSKGPVKAPAVIPFEIYQQLEARARDEGMSVPDLLTGWLSRPGKRRKGA